MSSDDGTQKQIRRRVRVSTARTGCNTCKKRHLKCDEEKPQCRRCRDAGWPCGPDEYPDNQSALVPVTRQLTALPGSKLERRSFRFFVDHGCWELAGYVESAFWQQLVLQRSLSDPAVRHAVVAVSGLYEKYQNSDMPDSGQLVQKKGGMTPDELILSAYNQAIQAVREKMSNQAQDAEETVLICCLLFICFENIRGNYDTASKHLSSGLNILRARRNLREYQSCSEHADGLSAYARTDTSDEHAILSFFGRLDIQATTNSMGDQGIRLASPKAQPSEYQLTGFDNLADARTACDRLMRQTMELLGRLKGAESLQEQRPHSSIAAANVLLTRFDLWHHTFQRLVARKGVTYSRGHQRAMHMLRMQHMTVSLLLRMALFPDRFDSSVVDDFKVILDSAEAATALLNSSKIGFRTQVPTFQSGMATIGSVYWVAITCPALEQRRRAIALLKNQPRREGMWDSRACARAAEQLLESGCSWEGATSQPVAPGVPALPRELANAPGVPAFPGTLVSRPSVGESAT